MALEGKIKDFGITDILQLIGMQKKTGIVTLTSEQDTVTITFEEGNIVSAESSTKWKLHLLGEVLVQAELLTEENRKRALSLQKETGQKFGHILVQEKMVRADDLASMIRLQVRETIFRVLEWKEGDYRFEQVPVTYDKENMLPVPCEKLLMEAMRITDEWPLVRKVISSYSIVYEKTDEKQGLRVTEDDLEDAIDGMFAEPSEKKSASEGEKALDKDFPLSAMEERIYHLVDGQKSVQKLIHVGRIGEFETCKAIYSLVSAGLIQPLGEEESVLGEEEVKEEAPPRFKKVLRNLAAYAMMILLVIAVVVFSKRSGGGRVFYPAGSLAGRLEPLKTMHALQEMHRILFASKVYFLELQSYPANLDELVREGFLEEDGQLDPWGTPYRYRVEQGKILLSSGGGDRREKTGDDLSCEISF